MDLLSKTYDEVLIDRLGCNCARVLGCCALDGQPVTMCQIHTRCRIVRVMRKRRDALTPTERRRRADAGIDGPLPQDLK